MTTISSETLRELQARVFREVPERFHYPRLLAVISLSEEFGELAEVISPNPDRASLPCSIEGEIGDVLLCCLEIANAYGTEISSTLSDRATAQVREHILTELSVAVGAVSKACLQLELTDSLEQGDLGRALGRVCALLELLAASLAIDIASAFDAKFSTILDRIASGQWERLYGDRLLKKRLRID